MTQKTAIILMNLGTPDAPTPSAVRAYLREFLSDQRVVEIPPIVWQIILNLFVLTTRPKRVAHAYASVWQDDSPIRSILKKQASQLSEYLATHHKDKADGIPIKIATTYGNPNIRAVLDECLAEGFERFVVLPLYPQYSATSTGAAFDATMRHLMKKRHIPSLIFINEYHTNPLYIKALAKSVQDFWQKNGRADKLLMSFHGIPKPFADKGDPYEKQCHATAKLLAKELELSDNEWAISFQSRFGAQEWLRPYTDELLAEWGKTGIKSVQIMSPAFSADCLETLEELAVENKNNFIKAGGQTYDYIPALNTEPLHIELMASLVLPYLAD